MMESGSIYRYFLSATATLQNYYLLFFLIFTSYFMDPLPTTMWGNPNLSSVNPHHHKWNLAVDTFFSTDHVVEIDLETTRCVFRLPKATTETKPEAYYPRRLGLGPYHHLRPEFYNMQLHKISRVRRFLGADKLEAFKEIVGDLVQREPVVRACYDEYLDFDIKTLARIIAIDALYLLQLFDARRNGEISDDMMGDAAAEADILMMENQIPFLLFKVILKVVGRWESVFSTEFGEFCEAHSPLQTQCQWMDENHLHILDRIYNSILANPPHHPSTAIISFVGVQAEAPPQILVLAERANKKAVSGPTAFELSESSGVKFECTQGGIRDIIYHVDRKSLQLPVIRIDSNTEIVLRNLVAYEAARAAAGTTSFELAEYLDLMCCLVVSNKDVIVLKKAEIIRGEVSDKGVVDVFDEIGKSTGDRRVKQPKFIVDEDDSKSCREVGCVVVKRIVKKCVVVTWRFLILVASVAVLAVLVLQAFCSVFACGRWSGRSAVQGFSYQ